jgi:hypothetical protein
MTYCQLDKPSASEVNTLPNSGLPAVSLIAPVSKVTVEAVQLNSSNCIISYLNFIAYIYDCTVTIAVALSKSPALASATFPIKVLLEPVMFASPQKLQLRHY